MCICVMIWRKVKERYLERQVLDLKWLTSCATAYHLDSTIVIPKQYLSSIFDSIVLFTMID